MKYFIDTEFIEGFHKPLFGKRRHFIDLISIGLVAEDGREYYAISKEFNPKMASQWVKDNVISKLPARKVNFYDSPRARQESLLWKSNEQIVIDILDFFGFKPEFTDYGVDFLSDDENIQVYGYYADYDWVLFCSLFGTMMDLPKGMPMYCNDLKQTIDKKVFVISNSFKNHNNEFFEKHLTFDERLKQIKKHERYPQQKDEHNALNDARWNRDLFNFLTTI